jgi:serine/threonine protein kinase
LAKNKFNPLEVKITCATMAESSLPGRAVTSALSSENSSELKQQSDPHTSVDPRFDRRFFIPHVYDFVSILKPADFHGVFQIPSLYLEPLAVDQSTVIGHGASFTTFKTAIPATPARSVTSEWNGSLVIVSESQESQVRHLVYKVARIAFTETGTPTPRTRHAMKAALMELYCLVHEPLREHPNIINLLGVAWGSNYFDPSHRLPVLVVEYADHGTLAQLQEKKDLGPDIRHCLAVNIGEGLKMLHRCGIIHGDVKSENILIFAHSEREFIAKLSDFGFSVIGEAASAEVDVGGTRPWKAPEAKSAVPKHLLQATDIYSYGLLLWRLATDGKDPFRFWVSSNLRGEAYLEELERIKEDDQPIRNTSLDVWFVPYILKKSLNFCLRPPQAFQVASGPFLSLAQQNSFYGRISPALEKCLSVNPTQRDLHEAVDLLTGEDHSFLGYVCLSSFHLVVHLLKLAIDGSPRTTNGDDILLRMSYDVGVC